MDNVPRLQPLAQLNILRLGIVLTVTALLVSIALLFPLWIVLVAAFVVLAGATLARSVRNACDKVDQILAEELDRENQPGRT